MILKVRQKDGRFLKIFTWLETSHNSIDSDRLDLP